MTKDELLQLKQRVGRLPFEARLAFVDDFAKCPFHQGESAKSLHLKLGNDSTWFAHCFSECKKSWDAIAFVQESEGISFPQAVEKLAGSPADKRPSKPKPKPVAMTAENWERFGRAIEQADVEQFAATRPHSHTASLEQFRALNVRVKDGRICIPYVHNGVFTGVKMRKPTPPGAPKDFIFANAVDTSSLFNLDAVNALEDLYIVEGEPDVLTMAEYGFAAISPFSSQQDRFNPEVLKLLLQAPRIFVIGDMDAPGKEFAERMQKLLPAAKTFRITFPEAKDVGELALKLGDSFATRITELSNNAVIPPVPWVRQHVPLIHQIPNLPKSWVAERMFPFQGLSLLSGFAGAQKSYLALHLAATIAGSRSKFLGRGIGMPTELTKSEYFELLFNRMRRPSVIYIDRENPSSEVFERRERLGIIGNNNFFYWADWTNQEPTPEPDDPNLMEIAERENAFVIFDSLQQWENGANENSADEMLPLMNKFKRLARRCAGVLLLHNDGRADRKTGESRTRGTSVIVASTDMAIHAAKTDDGVIQLRPDRFRMCAEWELDYRIHFNEQPENLPGKVFYAFEVLRDQTAAEVVRHEKAEDAKLQASQLEKDEADRQRIAAYLIKKPDAKDATMERPLGLTRKRIKKLRADLEKDEQPVMASELPAIDLRIAAVSLR